MIAQSHNSNKFPKIFPELAQNGANEYRIWAVARALDVHGSGSAIINIHRLSSQLNRTTATIRRMMATALDKGWLRGVNKLGTGIYKVYYTGIEKIARCFGLSKLGASFEVGFGELGSIADVRKHAIATLIQSLQDWKRRRHDVETCNSDKDHIIEAGQFIRGVYRHCYNQKSCNRLGGETVKQSLQIQLWRANLEGVDERYAYLRDGIPAGITLETISRLFGLSDRTIKRYTAQLEREYRECGFKFKVQTAFRLDSTSQGAKIEKAVKHLPFTLLAHGHRYIPSCNLYDPDLAIQLNCGRSYWMNCHRNGIQATKDAIDAERERWERLKGEASQTTELYGTERVKLYQEKIGQLKPNCVSTPKNVRQAGLYRLWEKQGNRIVLVGHSSLSHQERQLESVPY